MSIASVPILMYHSVSDTPSTSTRALSVAPTTFAVQLNYLRRQGFTGLTFGELCKRRRAGQPLPPKPIVLTFDDGYANFIEEALPMMIGQGYPATVFATTGWLHDAGPIAAGTTPDRMLSWPQLAELAAAGVEIGAHSHSHPQLDQISLPRLRAELADSKHMLEDRLGQQIESLAYPYGYSTKRVREVTREVGYLQAAAVANASAGPSCDPFRLPRLTIRRSTSPDVFARIVNQHGLRLQYASARTLTAGWAVARRTRSAARTLWNNAP
ncbi:MULTISPECIES: polysaccharide deacetylase family protein [unclassified Mycobacterium]|uniref:polysaccharide deacetylase family protein n=1 Tax=unclassified Mycobacterium TaxID=2642494 RepID=UPI0029C866D6|nr:MULTISPECIES: polysaccharide deacetylase family protein [unclassified Mycobacterium]